VLLTSNLSSVPQAEADTVNGLRHFRRVVLNKDGSEQNRLWYVGKRQPQFREGKDLFF
jgi:hypothetical protein